MTSLGGSPVAPSSHVVLVPIPVQGHLNPFISLANCLASSGVSVTLVRAARAHALLSYTDDPSSTSAPDGAKWKPPMRIEVVPDGMPTDPKQRFPMEKFRESITIIGKGVEDLLEKLMQEAYPPCCLIVDNLISWGNDVASKFSLPWMMLWTGSASGFSIGYHVKELVAKSFIPAMDDASKDRVVDFIPGLSPFRIRDLPKAINLEEDPEANPALQFFCALFGGARHAERLLVNSFYELESSVVEALRKEAGFRIDPIGPLFMMGSLLSNVDSHNTASLLQEDNSCLSWLDHQQEASVLYVSFGSVVSIEADALRELAHGLEASDVHFLWVIRSDAYADKASVEELLPEGFIERTLDRGRIIPWAPQLGVLGHLSVGAFLTHCGWNSVLESLCHGVPMLGFPQQAEQNTNLKLIVHDWQVGMSLLPSNVHVLERSLVQNAITCIVKGDEGAEVRKHALRWKKIALEACSGSSKANLENLVDALKSGHLRAPSGL